MTELKICPTCSSDDVAVSEDNWSEAGFYRYKGICFNCETSTRVGKSTDRDEAYQRALKIWNTRHDPYMPDWSKAPEGYEWHSLDSTGYGFFYKEMPTLIFHVKHFWHGNYTDSGFEIEGGCPEFYMTLRRRPV